MYNFIKNCQIIFQSSSPTLCHHHKVQKIQFIHILTSICYNFFIWDIWESVQWYNDFNLYIVDGKWHSTYFRVFIWHPEILFGKMSVHVFWEFFTYSRYKTFLAMWFANILSQSVVLFFNPLYRVFHRGVYFNRATFCTVN